MGKVRVAKSAGFCFGVERAVRMAISALEENGGPVYTLGPIIHNPQEVQRLENMDIRMVSSLDEIDEGPVIIRSHGAPKGVISEAEAKGLNVVDATCTLVKRLRQRVIELADEGYQVVIVGELEHPEVKAVLSFAEESCIVTRAASDLEGVKINKRSGLVAQTTQSLSNLQEVCSHMISRCQEVRVHNTICHATHTRRSEARALAAEVEVMIVVGGRNSANTNQLAESVREAGTATYHIESADEIRDLNLPPSVMVGVTAGASTPGWVIKEVVETLKPI